MSTARHRRLLRLALIIVAVLATGQLARWGPHAGDARAQSGSAANADRELSTRRGELDQLKRQLGTARRDAQLLKGREDKVLSELASIDRQVNVLGRYLKKLTEQEEALGARLDELRNDIETREEELGASRQRLEHRIRQMYKTGRPTMVEVIFTSESLPDVFRRLDLMMRLADEESKLMGRIDQARTELVAARREAEQRHLEVQLVREEKDAEHSAIVRLRGERKSRLGAIKNERKAREAAVVELAQAQKKLESLIERLEAAAVRGGDEFVPVSGPFADTKGNLPWPVRGKVTQSFGLQRNAEHGTSTRNNGIDIRAEVGKPVRAVADGKVIFRDWLTGYGNCVLLNHGGGYYTFYAHASEIMVDVGATVASGDIIAGVGDTGSLEGAMLHFEVRKGSKALNPRSWLGK